MSNHFIVESIKGPAGLDLRKPDLDFIFMTEVRQPGAATPIVDDIRLSALLGRAR